MVLAAFIVRRFSRLLNSSCRLARRDGSPLDPQEIGALGERIAASWLRSRGKKVLYRNFRASRGGEVDVVAREGKVLLFVEVKTRRAGGIGRPLDAVNRPKQQLIERGANEWLRLLGTRDLPWRFDVLEIILTEGQPPYVHEVRNAF
jgi:putative endonuclease